MPLTTDSRRADVPATPGLTQTELLYELEPVVEENLNRHLAIAKEWFPHAYVPWSDGENFDGPLDGTAWEVGQSKLLGDGPTLWVTHPRRAQRVQDRAERLRPRGYDAGHQLRRPHGAVELPIGEGNRREIVRGELIEIEG